MTMTARAGSDDERWAAVCARDPLADGRFVFAVRTTGVFCRPPCAARRPRRENVEFFDSVAGALAAGYRACKRCVPEAPSANAELSALVVRACRTIEAASAPPTLAELARAAGQSPFHFQRVFKRIVGLTPRAYAEAKRGEQLREALPAAPRVTDAVYEAGFGSSSRAYTLAASTLGMPPTAYRQRGRGQRLWFAAVSTRLGWLAVARTERGVAALELDADRATACARIAQRLSAADLREDPIALQETLAAIVRYVEAPQVGLDLPVDVQGTAFARRVWQALTQLGPGETATYAQIAARIGAPRAARAVARACASNPVPLVIPCHRVIPKTGGTGGYRLGAARKRALLEREAQASDLDGAAVARRPRAKVTPR